MPGRIGPLPPGPMTGTGGMAVGTGSGGEDGELVIGCETGMLLTMKAALSLGLNFSCFDRSFIAFSAGASGPDAGSSPSSQMPQL